MTRNILILATDSDHMPGGRRVGELFDQALIEIVHALDIPAGIASVLIPWSIDLSPLIAVAIVDTAPSFDPEIERSAVASRSGLVPYRLSESDLSDQAASFFRSSHLALKYPAPMSLGDALAKFPPTDIVVLSWSDKFLQFLNVDYVAGAQLAMFGSLLSQDRIASVLSIPASRVLDLELKLSPIVDDLDLPDRSEFAEERGRDAELEPFIPFGLLIQDFFDDLLPDNEFSMPRE